MCVSNISGVVSVVAAFLRLVWAGFSGVPCARGHNFPVVKTADIHSETNDTLRDNLSQVIDLCALSTNCAEAQRSFNLKRSMSN